MYLTRLGENAGCIVQALGVGVESPCNRMPKSLLQLATGFGKMQHGSEENGDIVSILDLSLFLGAGGVATVCQILVPLICVPGRQEGSSPSVVKAQFGLRLKIEAVEEDGLLRGTHDCANAVNANLPDDVCKFLEIWRSGEEGRVDDAVGPRARDCGGMQVVCGGRFFAGVELCTLVGPGVLVLSTSVARELSLCNWRTLSQAIAMWAGASVPDASAQGNRDRLTIVCLQPQLTQDFTCLVCIWYNFSQHWNST